MIEKKGGFFNINGKVVAYSLLYISAIIIIFLGAFFSFFSVLNDINLKVLNSEISGVVFGILVMYLGVRYYMAVLKLKPDLFDSEAKFSWSNFKFKKKKLSKG